MQAAAIDAYNEARPLAEDDINRVISAAVPLARTMSEQIKAIKSWAHDRAVSASKN